ncbi:alpha-galactosidase [Thioclava sp. FR2]|uniref:alpha-galactosidase n=1 Tax=Thioclava sp. FR2 TaxID=3445780 RepID=UPI003EC0C400
MSRSWRFDTPTQTLTLHSDGGVPRVTYWGPSLPKGEDLAQLARLATSDVTGGMIDRLPDLTLCPLARDSFPGQPGLIAYRGGEMLHPDLRLFAADDHHITVRDDSLGIGLLFSFTTDGDIISARTVLETDEPITLHWLSAPVIPGPQSGDILDFSGRWIGEFQPVRSAWTPGLRLREATGGRSGHEHPPFALFPEAGATNGQGSVSAMHYAWPGGHRMQAEELPDGRRQIQWGHAAGTQGTGTRFETADLLLTRSNAGLNGCATAFQRHIRDRVVTWPNPTRPRPVHYNCWEAVYFDHDLATLKDIATRAAALGAERFVLDDGWFGRRDDDTSSLGDWVIDRTKWPNGFTPLIDHINSLGMTFGLWFEPEMVNRNSDLARAHPDWILGPENQVEGRQQRVLNMALPQVRDHLFSQISAILSTHDIDYIKWDHNRLLPIADATQAHGTLDLMARLRQAHPSVEIESCASGGGRIDAGILRHTHRVWLSDSNDALERLRIQHGAALFLPAAITGSHVGPRHCHTSGRVIDIRIRAWVAAQRHMGFEMDPRELTEEEAEVLTRVTAWWKANRDWTMTADILRLDSEDPAIIAEMQLAQDGSRFVAFAGRAATSGQILPRPLRLTGLDPNALYRIRLVNVEDAHRLSRGKPALKNGPQEASGAWLMHHGLTLPWSFPQTMWVVEGERL